VWIAYGGIPTRGPYVDAYVGSCAKGWSISYGGIAALVAQLISTFIRIKFKFLHYPFIVFGFSLVGRDSQGIFVSEG